MEHTVCQPKQLKYNQLAEIYLVRLPVGFLHRAKLCELHVPGFGPVSGILCPLRNALGEVTIHGLMLLTGSAYIEENESSEETAILPAFVPSALIP